MTPFVRREAHNELEERVGGVEADVASMDAALTSQVDTLEETTRALNELAAEVEGVEDSIDALRDDSNNVAVDLTARIEYLANAVHELQNAMGDVDRLDRIERDLTALQTATRRGIERGVLWVEANNPAPQPGEVRTTCHPRPVAPSSWGLRVSYAPNGRILWTGTIIPRPPSALRYSRTGEEFVTVLRDHDLVVRSCYARNLQGIV